MPPDNYVSPYPLATIFRNIEKEVEIQFPYTHHKEMIVVAPTAYGSRTVLAVEPHVTPEEMEHAGFPDVAAAMRKRLP